MKRKKKYIYADTQHGDKRPENEQQNSDKMESLSDQRGPTIGWPVPFGRPYGGVRTARVPKGSI